MEEERSIALSDEEEGVSLPEGAGVEEWSGLLPEGPDGGDGGRPSEEEAENVLPGGGGDGPDAAAWGGADEAAVRKDRLEAEGGAAGSPDGRERRRLEVAEFLAEYPDIDPMSIPESVWAEVRAGRSLLSAYQRYENRRLRALIEAERKNAENRHKSLGSRQGGGPSRVRDEIEEDWYRD